MSTKTPASTLDKFLEVSEYRGECEGVGCRCWYQPPDGVPSSKVRSGLRRALGGGDLRRPIQN